MSNNKNISWMDETLVGGGKSKGPYRDVFLKAYGVVLHSSQFRRLSHKTQLLLNTSSDYARTRLTHSLEVSQISIELSRFFLEIISENKGCNLDEEFKRSFEYLTATSCLIHDIGHPPFGHAGEKILENLTKKYNSDTFDANKQNIRLLLGSDFRKHFSVPYCLVDAVMKYKGSTQRGCCYETEKEKVKKILEKTGLEELRHPSCYLMEAADDIAYLCGDIEDAIKHAILSHTEIKEITHELFPESLTFGDSCLEKRKKDLLEVFKFNSRDLDGFPKKFSSSLMKVLVAHVFQVLENVFSKNEQKNIKLDEIPKIMNKKVEEINFCGEGHNLLYCESLGVLLKKLKTVIYNDKILKFNGIVEPEYFSGKIIEDLFEELMTLKELSSDNFNRNKLFLMLPYHVQEKIKKFLKNNHTRIKEDDLVRVVCDYISGMTDRYAINFWEKIKTPMALKKVS